MKLGKKIALIGEEVADSEQRVLRLKEVIRSKRGRERKELEAEFAPLAAAFGLPPHVSKQIRATWTEADWIAESQQLKLAAVKCRRAGRESEAVKLERAAAKALREAATRRANSN